MRRFVIFGAAIAAVVLIWSAGWLFISNEVRTQVGVLALNDGYAAPRLTCATLEIGGYPFRFNATCTGVTVVVSDYTIEAPRVEAASLIFQLGLYHARVEGPALVKDAYLGGQSRIEWQNLEGSLRLNGGRIGRLSLIGADLAWSDTLMTETLVASAATGELHLVDVPEKYDTATHRAVLAGYLSLNGAAIPAWTVANGDLTASVEVSAVPDTLETAGPDALREWQAAGGKLSITEIKASEGEDIATITGEIALNAEGLAEGNVELASRGILERSAGLVPPEIQPIVFGAPGDDGTYRQRFTITNGVAFAGMLPVFGFSPQF